MTTREFLLEHIEKLEKFPYRTKDIIKEIALSKSILSEIDIQNAKAVADILDENSVKSVRKKLIDHIFDDGISEEEQRFWSVLSRGTFLSFDKEFEEFDVHIKLLEYDNKSYENDVLKAYRDRELG